MFVERAGDRCGRAFGGRGMMLHGMKRKEIERWK